MPENWASYAREMRRPNAHEPTLTDRKARNRGEDKAWQLEPLTVMPRASTELAAIWPFAFPQL